MPPRGIMPLETSRLPISSADDRKVLLGLLESLPSESDRAFERTLTDLVGSNVSLVPLLRAIAEDDRLETSVRYAAFFAVCAHLRRHRDTSALMKLLLTHEDAFGAFGTFSHLYSMAVRSRSDPGDARLAVERARVASMHLPNHAGVLHNFAETVIAALEEDEPLDDRATLLRDAEESLLRAISLDPLYPKFYCTKGRLAALKGHYTEAKQLVRRAIDHENSRENDYWGRISSYEGHLLRIRLRETFARSVNELEQKLKNLQSDLQSTAPPTAAHFPTFHNHL